MKRKHLLLGGIIIVFIMLFLLFLFKSSIPYAILARPQEGKLNFTVTPEKTHVKEGENFKINLVLKNTGDNRINVWKLEEQVSYNIIISYQNGTGLPYLCGVIGRLPLTNEYLTEINPGESITHIQDSSCWELNSGEYSLRAVYYTQPGERITKPYWVGSVESEAVKITVEATREPTASTTESSVYNEIAPLKINNTFETWSRGYWSNLSYIKPYFRVITTYSEWNDFLDNQGYFEGVREGPPRLEGELFPGWNKTPKRIEPVDFNNYFIIAAMMGAKGKKGPEIEIKNISRSNNVVKVTIRMYDPGYGATVVSAPYNIVIVKRALLPMGNSTFHFRDTEDIILGDLRVIE